MNTAIEGAAADKDMATLKFLGVDFSMFRQGSTFSDLKNGCLEYDRLLLLGGKASFQE